MTGTIGRVSVCCRVRGTRLAESLSQAAGFARDDGLVLQLSVRLVHADQVENLRSWFGELQTTRRAEAVATLVDETVDQETAILVELGSQHLLVYAIDVRDPEQSRRSADSGKHPIDAEHRNILQQALVGMPTCETILNLTP